MTPERITELWGQITAVDVVPPVVRNFVLAIAREARREALEEAARVCDVASNSGEIDSYCCAPALECAAAAIRALIEEQKL